MHRNDFGNAFGCHAQRVVCLGKGIDDGQFGINLAEAFVVDDQKGIYVLGYLLDAVQRLIDLLVSLELEGNGDDADGQDACILRALCNDGSSASACAAAHACCDEDHAGTVVEHLADVVDAFLSTLTSHCGVVAGTKAVLAQLQVVGNRRVVESLLVRIANHVGHLVYAFAIHVIDGVAATAAYAYYLDDTRILCLRHYEVNAAHWLYVLFFCHSCIYLR